MLSSSLVIRCRRFSTYATLWVKAALRKVLQEQSLTLALTLTPTPTLTLTLTLTLTQVETLISRGSSREREGGGALAHDGGHSPAPPRTWPGVHGGPVASLMRTPLEPVKVRLRRAEEVRK